MPLPKVTFAKLWQYDAASAPMDVTVLGTVSSVIAVRVNA